MSKTLTLVAPSDDAGALLDKKGAARRMMISVRSIDIMMRDRKLPYFKLGKSVRFRKSDIDTALEKFRVA